MKTALLLAAVTLAALLAPPALAAHPAHATRGAPRTAPLTAAAVNDTTVPLPRGAAGTRIALLRAQILLDRAHFSPGEIDARPGSNMKKALAAYQHSNGLDPSGVADAPTWALLNADTAPVLVDYTLVAADVAGPFAPLPKDIEERAKLPALGFATPAEALGEKFHVSPALLVELNRGKDLGREGEVIVVPDTAAAAPLPRGARLVVNKAASTVTLQDAAGKTLAHFPASVGSTHDPLPLGAWKVLGVARNPPFHYDPKLFWDADPKAKRIKLPPGPNGPVGVVWIDLSKPHYGIHGTPEPSAIGKTQSHGCIRLTNWDATALSQAVFPGMPAVLEE